MALIRFIEKFTLTSSIFVLKHWKSISFLSEVEVVWAWYIIRKLLMTKRTETKREEKNREEKWAFGSLSGRRPSHAGPFVFIFQLFWAKRQRSTTAIKVTWTTGATRMKVKVHSIFSDGGPEEMQMTPSKPNRSGRPPVNAGHFQRWPYCFNGLSFQTNTHLSR